MNYLNKNLCKKILKYLDNQFPETQYWYSSSGQLLNESDHFKGCGRCGAAGRIMPPLNSLTPAFGVQHILMPDGILERLAIKNNCPTGAPGYKEKIGFINIWDIEGWEGAEKFIEELL